jgi:predicted RNA-binding Zn-ribbon protein involved in translation (DUF1610 family)
MLCPKCGEWMDEQQTLDGSDLYTCERCKISLCVEDFSDMDTDEAKAQAWNTWYPVQCPKCKEELELDDQVCPSCGEPRPAPKAPEPKGTYLEEPERLRWCESCGKVLDEVVYPYHGDMIEAWNPAFGQYEHGKDNGYEIDDSGEICPDCGSEVTIAEPEAIALWEQARKVKVP